jgi:hypothetical protein
MSELREQVTANQKLAVDSRRKDKSGAKIKQEVVKSRDHQGREKEKYINVITYPSGVIERRLVGLKKNGKVIFDKGIKK